MKPAASGAFAFDAALPALSALERRLSLKAVLIALAAAFFLIAWNRGIALLYGGFALLLATIVVAWLAPRLNLAGLRASRHCPREAHVGDTVRLSLTLGARGWPRRYMLELEERLPFAPGRTVRVFLPNVGRQTDFAYDVPCLLRGRHELAEVTLATGFPLGLAHARRRLDGTASGRAPRLTVYPRIFPVGPMVMEACAGGDGSRPTSPRGRDLFREIRPYRHGDNMRDIHWRASARTGALLVKELDHLDARELLLVPDLDVQVHAGEGVRHSLEYAIALCASISAAAITRGQAVGLAGGRGGGGLPALWIAPAHGPRHLRSLLEALVDVQADAAPYGEVLNAVSATGCRARRILFRHGRTPVRGLQTGSLVFEFDTASFEPGAAPVPGWRRGAVVHVTAASDLAALLA